MLCIIIIIIIIIIINLIKMLFFSSTTAFRATLKKLDAEHRSTTDAVKEVTAIISKENADVGDKVSRDRSEEERGMVVHVPCIGLTWLRPPASTTPT